MAINNPVENTMYSQRGVTAMWEALDKALSVYRLNKGRMPMGLIVGTQCHVECDDPAGRGCKDKTNRVYGQPEAAAKVARRLSWFQNPHTGKWTCPSCMQRGFSQNAGAPGKVAVPAAAVNVVEVAADMDL